MAYKDSQNYNGDSKFKCPVSDEWDNIKQLLDIKMEAATTELSDISSTLKNMNDNLVNAATGKKHVPIEIILLLLAIWGVHSIFIAVRDTNKDIKFSLQEGLQITESHSKKD